MWNRDTKPSQNGSPIRPWSIEGSTAAGEEPNPGTALSPTVLAYVMAPAALAVILLLMRAGVVVREPVWLWVLVFVAILSSSRLLDHFYVEHPTSALLQVRVASGAAGVTAVIYLTGWGPVLLLAYAFLALENVAWAGSRVWRITALWSVLGIIVGQVAIWQGWIPTRITLYEANAMAIMGGFVLFFIIRMAGATMEQKEDAESSMRLSEDRFRSLIQNSTDATIVVGGGRTVHVRQPGDHPVVGIGAQRDGGAAGDGFCPPRRS